MIPITLPSASSSGPPELPRLIAASVWIALSIEKSVSASIVRFLAETTPTESDCCSPNGLPIAATGSPTANSSRSESCSGTRLRPFGSTLTTPTSALGSKPTISAGTWLPSLNWTKTSLAGFGLPPPLFAPPLVTTCALVAM